MSQPTNRTFNKLEIDYSIYNLHDSYEVLKLENELYLELTKDKYPLSITSNKKVIKTDKNFDKDFVKAVLEHYLIKIDEKYEIHILNKIKNHLLKIKLHDYYSV